MAQNRLTSVEDVGLDIDSTSIQLSSSLFQHLTHGRGKSVKRSSRPNNKLHSLLGLVPRQVQVKMENCGAVLDHTDKVSQVEARLHLFYLSFKCNEVPRLGSLPDSHLTGQLSGFNLMVPGRADPPIVDLFRFQALVQKEGSKVNSDTQVKFELFF